MRRRLNRWRNREYESDKEGSLEAKGLNPADNFSRAVIAPDHPLTAGVQLRGKDYRQPYF